MVVEDVFFNIDIVLMLDGLRKLMLFINILLIMYKGVLAFLKEFILWIFIVGVLLGVLLFMICMLVILFCNDCIVCGVGVFMILFDFMVEMVEIRLCFCWVL